MPTQKKVIDTEVVQEVTTPAGEKVIIKRFRKPVFMVAERFYRSDSDNVMRFEDSYFQPVKAFKVAGKAKKEKEKLELEALKEMSPSWFCNESLLELSSAASEKRLENSLKKLGITDLTEDFNAAELDDKQLKKYRKLFDKLEFYHVLEVPVG